MEGYLKITDAFKIWPYYPEILMIPIYHEDKNKYSMMIVERLEGNREGKTLYTLNEPIFVSEEAAVLATGRNIQVAMSAVRVMLN